MLSGLKPRGLGSDDHPGRRGGHNWTGPGADPRERNQHPTAGGWTRLLTFKRTQYSVNVGMENSDKDKKIRTIRKSSLECEELVWTVGVKFQIDIERSCDGFSDDWWEAVKAVEEKKPAHCVDLRRTYHIFPQFWCVSVRHSGRQPNLQGPGSDDPRSGGDDWWVAQLFLLWVFFGILSHLFETETHTLGSECHFSILVL